ncbi:MAG: TIGR00730 family Rossman fold protein [Phycisphaerales bacterium]|nr:TIGR00730 family Rossman fold protein [Phycisphaerales bacterium]
MTTRPGSIEQIRLEMETLLDRLAPEAPTDQRAFVADVLRSAVMLLHDGCDSGQIKLMSKAVKEMRRSWQVFNHYRGVRKVTIYGSARTPEDHPDYESAREFGRQMADEGWMAITGAGDGIMKAGHEGPKREASFGLRIRLPFETSANEVIEGDPKLVSFRYFFTRKLMFMAHADAVAVFPGGFGTMDELFEALTLIQTGKSNMVPIVLVEGVDGTYWPNWMSFIREELNDKGFISGEDLSLVHLASSPRDAQQHILKFYRRFHSSRYVGGTFVIRLSRPLTDEQVEALNTEFADVVDAGRMSLSGPLRGETDHLDLPRLGFVHTRRDWGRMRQLVDRINDLP